MDYKKEKFHQTLQELSKKIISSNILDALKCQCQDVLSVFELSYIVTPSQLFQTLKDHGKLSVNNTQYLANLLIAIGKSELVEILSVSSTSEPVHGSSYYIHSATSPPNTVEEQYHSLPWDAGTRNAPQRYSAEILPVHGNHYNFVTGTSASSVPVKCPGDQQQWELNGGTYSEQTTRIVHEQEEYTKYKTESSHQEYHVETRNPKPSEGYLSLPLMVNSQMQQRDPGWLTSTSPIHHQCHANPFDTIYPSTVNQQKLSVPVQECDESDDDDENLMSHMHNPNTCLYDHANAQLTNGHLNVSLSQAMQTGVHYRNSTLHEFQVVQELRSIKEKMEQYEQTIERLVRANSQPHPQCKLIEENYQMDKNPHGIAVIINNYIFHSSNPDDKPMPNRRGSQVDEDNLCFIWKYLLYEVHVFKNCTASKLIDELRKIASLDHEKYDSFVCCILSHGYLDGVYGADSKPVDFLKDIKSLFLGRNCITLAGKPKLFFLQACRGEDEDQAVFLNDKIEKDGKHDQCNSLPNDTDFLLGYATPSGKVAWRSPQSGSWYISVLHDVFYEYALHKDLLSMLTIINLKVSEELTSEDYKQCPAPVTSLRKQVWFFKNYYASL